MTAAGSIISARGLVKHYGRRVGVDGVDLDVPEGAIFGFLGPNGAGKTTTIRLLLGFLRADRGEAAIFGRDCWSHSHEIKRDVGYVPGDLRLYPWMTAAAALNLVSVVRGRDARGAGRALAERFRLEMDVTVRQMSRGTRQKLGMVLALVPSPRLIVLDEPTSGLDPLIQDELARVLRERAASGATVFFSSHTLGEVESLCDRIAIVRDGRIVADEPLSSLRARATRTVTIRFRAPVSVPALSGLRLHERTPVLWRGELDGAAADLLRWLATQSVEDLEIGAPNLEGIFRSYYRRDEGLAP